MDLGGYSVGERRNPAQKAPNRTQAREPAGRPFRLTHWICLLKDWCATQS